MTATPILAFVRFFIQTCTRTASGILPSLCLFAPVGFPTNHGPTHNGADDFQQLGYVSSIFSWRSGWRFRGREGTRGNPHWDGYWPLGIILFLCLFALGFRRKPICSHGATEQHINDEGLLPDLRAKGCSCGVLFSFICTVFPLRLWFPSPSVPRPDRPGF